MSPLSFERTDLGFRIDVFDSLKAGNGTRTRDPQLGKLMLYQLSYARNTAIG